MVKIDFEKFPCYVDIRKEKKVEMNVKFDFANQMYIHGRGVDMGALAIKIYNSHGETEYNEQECKLIINFANNFPPVFADSIKDAISK